MSTCRYHRIYCLFPDRRIRSSSPTERIRAFTQYASGSSTSTSVQAMLDKDRFYKAALNGPLHSGKKPTLKLTFSVPKQAK